MAGLTFPNETDQYRDARDELLQAEIELRAQVERVAAMRRGLPLGGLIKEDYAFEEIAGDEQVRAVKLSELFEGSKTSLFVYSWMYSKLEGDPRHMDLMWPLWNVLDTTPEGRGDWYPPLNV